MRQKYVLVGFIIAILTLTIVFFMMRNYNEQSEIKVDIEELNAFEKKVALIEHKVIDLTNPNDLLSIKEFNELVKSVTANYNVVLMFISDTNKSEQKKQIAIYTLRDLDFDNYLNFFKKCLLLFQKKQLSENVLMTVLSPGSEWNCTIVENFDDKRVIRLLKSNKKRVSVEMKEVFEYTLSGEMWASIEDERSWTQEEL